jgi:hypothetical protein
MKSTIGIDLALTCCRGGKNEKHCQQVKVRNQPVGRQGLVAILRSKIAARPWGARDCSGNPASPAGAEELQRKARFLARERQKGAHLFDTIRQDIDTIVSKISMPRQVA